MLLLNSFCAWYLDYFNDFNVVYIQIASDKPSTYKTDAKTNNFWPSAKNLLGLHNLLQCSFKFSILSSTYNWVVWGFFNSFLQVKRSFHQIAQWLKRHGMNIS